MTPGNMPCRASLRMQIRQQPNLRRKARGRPHKLQRLLRLTANFGFLTDFAMDDCFATMLPLVRPQPVSGRGLAERHTQKPQKFPRLLVRAGGGHDSDVHATHLLYFRIIDFQKDQLVLQSKSVVAPSIK
jgi:hypothetical protein